MKKVLFVLLVLVFLFSRSHAQIFTWGSASTNGRNHVTADILGNIYTCGVDGSAGRAWVLDKFSPNGTLLWTAYDGGGGSNYSNLNKLIVSPSGDIYAIGNIYPGAVIGGTPVSVAGTIDYVLVKYNSQGVLQWSKLISGPTNTESVVAVQLTQAGNVLIAGTYQNSISIAGNVLNTSGYHLFWSEISPAGNVLANHQFAATTASAWSAVLDSNDDLYFAASYNSQQSVMKIGMTGNLIWSWGTGGGNGEFWDIATDSNGDVYVTGEFDGNMTVSGLTYTSQAMLDDILVAKVNANGTFGWFKQFGGLNGDNGNAITVDGNGHIFVSGYYQGNCDFDQMSLTSMGGSAEVFYISMDTSGTMRWVMGGGGSNFDNSRGIFFNPSTGHIHAVAFIGSTACNFSQYHFPSGTSGVVLTITDSSCVASGTVYRDMNANGSWDAGDQPFPHRVVEMNPGPYHANSGQTGSYAHYSNVGSYTLTVPNPPLYYNASGPSTQTATFTQLGQIDSLNHFGFAPIPGMNDLMLNLTPCNYGARSGMTEMYTLTWENIGTTTISNAELRFGFDNSLSLSAASPAVSNMFGSDSAAWNLGNISPGATGLVRVFLYVPSGLAIGQPLEFHAGIFPLSGDQTPGDNVQSVNQLVVNSWDPNDKRVMPERDITSAEVSSGIWLTYTIRFQNTGNDTAYFVRLKDTLDLDLDIGSLEFLSESHPSHWNLSQNHILTVDFEDIDLVDSTTNEPLSHGFFKYRVKPRNTLMAGDRIDNTAHIYFDFNPPVITPTVTTHVANPAFSDPDRKPSAFEVFPNPAHDKVWVRSKAGRLTCSPLKFTLTGLSGNLILVREISGDQAQISLPDMASGLYLYSLEDTHGSVLETGKLQVK